MVESVRQGDSLRSVAKGFSTSLSTVQRWVERTEGMPLDFVDWSNRSTAPKSVANRTASDVEERVVSLRMELKEKSDLGEYGADAIHQEMIGQGQENVPSVRTINRILERKGLFDSRHRVRWPPPPKGWYLPDAASGKCEVDLFDVVTGFVIEGGTDVEVLNAVSLFGGLSGSWVSSEVTAKCVVEAIWEHWSVFGCPGYVQFDNDTRFQGPHQFQDVVSRVMRLSLSLGVVPVFTPVCEAGFQAAVESFNNRWQQKVWERHHHESLEELQACSTRYINAVRRRCAVRQEGAPKRQPVPDDWEFDLQARPCGKVIFLRRTDEHGRVGMLGHSFDVDEHWTHRLVRAEVELPEGFISFYALRRREPSQQTLLNQIAYVLPKRRFKDR